MNDLKFATRQLLKNPGFTAVAVLTLALGIGGTAAIYTVLNKLMLNPLPSTGAGKLIQVAEQRSQEGPIGRVSPPVLAHLREHLAGLAEFAWSEVTALDRDTGDFVEMTPGMAVSPNFFNVLGVQPMLGRTFAPDEGSSRSADGTLIGETVIVLSHALWQSTFGADPNLLGRQLNWSGRSFTVIGIMPPSFGFPWGATRFWVPAADSLSQPSAVGSSSVDVVARLKPGVSEQQARTAFDLLSKRLVSDAQRGALPLDDRNAAILHSLDWRLQTRPLNDHFADKTQKKTLFGLLGAFVFILVVVCCNLTNLSLVRIEHRRHEIAIRAALGAGRLHLLRQLLAESTLLTLLGGLAGALVALWGVRLLLSFIPAHLPRLREIHIGLPEAGLITLSSLGIGLIIGGISFLRLRKKQLALALKGAATATNAGMSWRSGQGALVIVQVAMTMVVLTGTGLMIRSVLEVLRVNPGHNPTNLLSVRLNFPFHANSAEWSSERRSSVLLQARERLATLPGVQAVGELRVIRGGRFTVDDRPELVDLTFLSVTTGRNDYFTVMQAPIIAGRGFNPEDASEGSNAVIVNQTLAQLHWPGESPIGKTLGSRSGGRQNHVIGVVANIHDRGYDQPMHPFVYRAHDSSLKDWLTQVFAVRTEGDPRALVPVIRKELHGIASDMLMPNIELVAATLFDSTRDRRIYLLCLLILAGVGLGLSAVGIHGVLAYSVACRTREVGIRMALGATRGQVVGMIVIEGARLALLGVCAGVVAAYWLTSILENQLFGISHNDGTAFVGSIIFLLAVAAFGCWLPARRAARVNPMEALRQE